MGSVEKLLKTSSRDWPRECSTVRRTTRIDLAGTRSWRAERTWTYSRGRTSAREPMNWHPLRMSPRSSTAAS